MAVSARPRGRALQARDQNSWGPWLMNQNQCRLFCSAWPAGTTRYALQARCGDVPSPAGGASRGLFGARARRMARHMRFTGLCGGAAALCALLARPAAAFPLLYDGNGGATLTTALGANLSLSPSNGGARVRGTCRHVPLQRLARRAERAPRLHRQHCGRRAAECHRGRGQLDAGCGRRSVCWRELDRKWRPVGSFAHRRRRLDRCVGALAASLRSARRDRPLLQRHILGVRVRRPLERRQLHRAVCCTVLAGRRLHHEPMPV